ncbi:hypothetical protein [Halalkalibacter alkalisediminis]|uniref:DUF5667 domain-containing protein n=1 Tax=Halalkalibacter alkalisediminis TaxID=935616 RepID=A0ABV6NC83_9BACI|nr:hypothetical protein [Halalkalibacter alkalisediminis]
MKKMLALLVVGLFFTGQTAYANEVTVAYEQKINASEVDSIKTEDVFVDSELIGFVDIFQEVALELSSSENERLMLLVEFIAQKNNRLQVLITEERFAEATAMLQKYNNEIDEIQELLDRPYKEELEAEELNVYKKTEEQLAEKISMRGVNLKELLESGDLPAPALAGIEKALANQERAEEKRQLAQERKEHRKAEKKASKQGNEEEVVVTTGEEKEITGTSVQKQNGKAEKAQKAQDQVGNQAEKGKEKAAKAQEKGKDRAEKAQQTSGQQSKGNNGKDK